MFYEGEINKAELRLGDVISGGLSTTPHIIESPTIDKDFKINIGISGLSVVITPCCSIKGTKISLAPLTKINKKFFDNSYFADDLTRINRLVNPENRIPPQFWNDLPHEKKQAYIEEGMTYTNVELFIYEKNDLFEHYTLGDIETGYYMVNFKDTYRIDSTDFKSADNFLLRHKILQLSVKSRSELREKLAFYYGRIPAEDLR